MKWSSPQRDGYRDGHIGAILARTEAEQDSPPAEARQTLEDLAVIAGIASSWSSLVGPGRDESFNELFITGVALAVAAIPRDYGPS